MSIVQISKIQQRSGNLVDLPQLDEAEFGWASDAKRLFIGKTTPNENIEVLTSYSQINYSQINGSVGNLNISNVTVADGQVLVYDGNNWVNRGGDAGGLITLGNVSNIKITGGAIGYVLETDGLGNLSWTPKSTVIAYIQNVTQANPAVITTTQDNFFTDGAEITITNASGMTQLNGNTYYANVLTSNTFALYSDPSLTTTVNSTGYGQYSYTTATATTASTNRVTVGNSALFSLNQEVRFLGSLSTSGLENNFSYYIKTKPSGTTITVSEELLANGTAGNTKSLTTATLTGANVYAVGGRAIASVAAGGGGNAAAGSNTTVQFNNSNLLDGDADFTWNFGASPKVLGIVGNANVGNLNATGVVTSSQLVSNIATGTAPLTVTSTTRVANLNVSYSNVSDFNVVTAQTTGTFFPVFANGSTTANRALGANANLSFNAATGALSATLLTGTLTTAAQPNVTSLGTLTSLSVTGNVTSGNVYANSGTIGASLLTGTLTTAAQPNVTSLGTLTSLNVTGNVIAGNMYANSGRIGASLLTGTLTTAAQPNVTSVGTLTSLNVSGNANVGNLGTAQVLATANVTSPQLISNVATGTAPLVVSSTTRVGNLNVAYANVADFVNVTTQSSGNAYLMFANALTGNVAETANAVFVANTSNGALYATTFIGTLSGAATTAGTVTTAAQPNITSVGTLTGLGVNGNITAANITANTGVFTGNGSGLSAIAGANVTGTVSSATTATTAGTVTTAAQPNITSVGTLTGLGVNGNITAANITANTGVFTGNGSGLSALNASNLSTGTVPSARLSGSYSISVTSATTAGTVTTNAQPNITSVGTLTGLAVSGNAAFTGANISLGSNANVKITGGTGGQILGTDGAGNLSWLNQSSIIGGAAGTNTQVQYNALGILGASSNFTFNYLTNVLSVNGNIASNGTIGGASANLYGNELTTGANTTAGSITGNWTLTAGSRMEATYADLAEYYEADDIYPWGTVLEFGGDKEITIATNETTKVAGVVSKNPAYVMNATCPGLLTAVALQGRVPCNVIGPVSKGDMMVSAGAGYAKACSSPSLGTVIGKSLVDFDGVEGIIEIAVGRL